MSTGGIISIYEGSGGNTLALPRSVVCLHRLGDKAAHLIRHGLLYGWGGMSVGVQGEARRVVAQDAGHGFGVHAVLDGQGGVGVAQIVEADVLGNACFLA